MNFEPMYDGALVTCSELVLTDWSMLGEFGPADTIVAVRGAMLKASKHPAQIASLAPLSNASESLAMPNAPAMVQDARAWYRPANDTVGMPSLQAFGSAEEY
jgi:hypothetical protein